MDESRVRIEMTQPGRGTVWLNGVKVPNVRAVKTSAAVDEANSVILDIIADHWEYEGPAIVHQRHAQGLDDWLRYNETHASRPSRPSE